MRRFWRWLNRHADQPVLIVKSSEAPRGTVSSVKQAQKDIERLAKLTDSRIRRLK